MLVFYWILTNVLLSLDVQFQNNIETGGGGHSDKERCVFTYLSHEFCPGLSSDLDLKKCPITSEKRPEDTLCVSRIITVMHNVIGSCYNFQ